MLLADVLLLVVIGGIIWGVVRIFSNRTGISRKEHRKALAQNAKMKSLLSRVAANDVGNPSLEAQLLLGEFSAADLKELES